MITVVNGAPVYIDKIDNVVNHQQLLDPFVNDESFWRNADEWMSNTKTTHNHPNNHLLPWHAIIPEINFHLEKYLQIFKPTAKFEIEAYPWLNKYDQGNWQEQHNHIAKDIYFSMAYIIKGNGQNNFVFAESPNVWHSFIDPEGLFDAWPNRHYIPEQIDGTLIIFPSTLDHFVLPNKSTEQRITASANFALIKD